MSILKDKILVFAKNRDHQILICLSVLIQVVLFVEIYNSPVYGILLSDSKTYYNMAVSLANGEPWTYSVFWQAVFYPVFLSYLFKLFSSSILTAIIFQILLNTATVLLTYKLATQIFNRKTGLLSGVLLSLSGPFLFFNSQILATSWATFWCVLLVLILLRAVSKQDYYSMAAVGFISSLAIITRPTFLLFIGASFIWLFYQLRTAGDKGWYVKAGVVLVFVSIILLPLSIKSKELLNTYSILPTSGSLNLYIGNGTNSCDKIRIRPGYKWHKLVQEPHDNGARTPLEGENYFKKKVLSIFLNNPISFMSGLLFKSIKLFSSVEIPRNLDIYVYSKWSWVLKSLTWRIGSFGFPFGLIFPLAVFGLIFNWRKVEFPVYGMIVFYSFAVILAFASSRYRVPLIPLFYVLAAAGITSVPAFIRNWVLGWRCLFSIGFTVLAFIACILPTSACEDSIEFESEIYYTAGNDYSKQGDSKKAVDNFKRSIALNPGYGSSHFNLAMEYEKLGLIQESIQHWYKAIEIHPDNDNAYIKLGFNLALTGRVEEALKALTSITRYSKTPELVYFSIAKSLYDKKNFANAIPFFKSGLGINNKYAEAYGYLGESYGNTGDFEKSANTYIEALDKYPKVALFSFKLGMSYAMQKKWESAIDAISKAVLIKPNEGQYQYYLIAFYLNSGQTDKAQEALLKLQKISPEWAQKAHPSQRNRR